MLYGKASPAFWRSNAAAPSCTRSSTATTRSIRNFGPRPGSSAGWDWGFRSNLRARHGRPKVWPSCTANWGGNRRRDHYISTLSAAQTIVETRRRIGFARHGCRGWLSGEVSAAVPATLDVRSLNHSGTGVSGTLPCLQAPLMRHSFLAPADNAWVIVDLAGARGDHRTGCGTGHGDVIDVRLEDATPVGTSARCGGDPRGTDAGHDARRRCRQRRRCPFHHRAHHCLHERARAVRPADRGIPGNSKHRAADLATKLAVADESWSGMPCSGRLQTSLDAELLGFAGEVGSHGSLCVCYHGLRAIARWRRVHLGFRSAHFPQTGAPE